MTIDWAEQRRLLREKDIGKEIKVSTATTLPSKEQVSDTKMKWMDAAVIYCDLSGYTTMTHDTRNKTVARILKAFHSSMVRIAVKCKGRIYGIAGDRVMAVIALENRDKTIFQAMKMALAMQTVVRYMIPEELEIRNFSLLNCSLL